MADVLRIKRRPVGGAVGPPATLAAAEIAFNEQDNTLYYGKGNSGGVATSIIPIAGSTFTGVSISDTAPATPAVGSLWWDSVIGNLFLRFNDGTSTQWVPAVNQPGPMGLTGPAGPTGADGPGWLAGTGLTLNTATDPDTISLTIPVLLAYGGTGADLSATGGAGQVLRQSTVGGAVTVAVMAPTDLSGLGAGVATWLATPTSANLMAAMTDETGTAGGALVFNSSPTLSSATLSGTTNNGGTTLSCAGLIQISMAQPGLYLSAAAAGSQAFTSYQVAGANRWILGKTNVAEGGSNAGSDFGLQRFSDAGGFLGYAWLVERATGRFAINVGAGQLPQAALHVTSTARIYNTYTDASNGEWTYLGDWAGNVSRFGTSMNGTGVGRYTALMAGGAEVMRLDPSNRLLIGATQSYNSGGFARTVQIYTPAGVQIGRHSADTFAPGISFSKSRNVTVGSHTAVVADDQLLQLSATGSDGTDYRSSSQIISYVDGPVSANVVPGRMTFWTTDTAGTHNQRLSISGTTATFSVGITATSLQGPIGTTTPNTGSFTSLYANSSLLFKSTTSYIGSSGFARSVQFYNATGVQISRHINDVFCDEVLFTKSRNTTVGSHTAVVADDDLGQITFAGSDGAAYINGALIRGSVDGSVSTGVMPTRLIFATRDITGVFVERMRITSAGLLTFGGGATSAIPALKNSSANLEVRLGDDSAYASLLAATAATADNGNTVATTAFVKAQGYATTTALGSYLPLSGGALTGNLSITTAGNTNLALGSPAGLQGFVSYYTVSALRWIQGKTSDAEGGSNAGSNFGWQRFSDAGAFIAYAVLIERATGRVGLNFGVGPLPQANLHINNAGGSATARIYNTYTDASNGEWAYLGDWAGNVTRYGSDKNGTGAARDVVFMAGGIEAMRIAPNAATTYTLAPAVTTGTSGNPRLMDYSPTLTVTNATSVGNVWGIDNSLILTGTTPTVTSLSALGASVTLAAGMTGTVSTGRGVYVAATNSTGRPGAMTTWYAFHAGTTTNGQGLTTGTVSNSHLLSGAITAGSAGGTINNQAIYVTTPSGSPSAGTTNNHGVYITGDGGTASGTGTVVNYALLSDSTALSVLRSLRIGQPNGANNGTTATERFLYISASAGVPTGVPRDAAAGSIALQWDSTNKKLMVYDQPTGTWKGVTLA